MCPEMSKQATRTPHGSCSSPSGQNMHFQPFSSLGAGSTTEKLKPGHSIVPPAEPGVMEGH